MPDEPPVLDEQLRALSRLLIGTEPFEATLQRIVELADRAFAGTAAGCSVTLASPTRTAVATNDAVRAIDVEEYALREGPCIAAMDTGEVQHIDDAGIDERFPRFGAVLVREHLCSALGVPLVVGGAVIGALNVYGVEVHAFRDRELQVARWVADEVAVVLANTRTFHDSAERVRQLQEALDTRVIIEQAKGVLMERHRLSPGDAFARLREQSQRENRKLRLVAADVVGTVEPDRP